MVTHPHFFVVGCPRSGTTLLQRMLDAHPQLAVANDAHFIHHGIHRRAGDVPLTPHHVDRVVSLRSFHRFAVSEAEARDAARGVSTYAEFVGALFARLAATRRKPLSGEKAPLYVRYLPLLHSLFPRARVVHVVRDGRDVALSTLEWARPGLGPGRVELWRLEPVAVSALFWRWHVTTGLRDGSAHEPSLYHEVLYERLLDDPETELQTISVFLGVPYADDMLAYHEGKTRKGRGLSAKSAWLPPTRGLRDWRRDMAENDVELFEALAGDVLSFYGYDRGYPEVSEATRTHAERCRAQWEAELRARNRPMASLLDLRIDPAQATQRALA